MKSSSSIIDQTQKSPKVFQLVTSPSYKRVQISNQKQELTVLQSIVKARSTSFKQDNQQIPMSKQQDSVKKSFGKVIQSKPSPMKIKTERKLKDMSPRQITNLLKENQMLRDEMLKMQALIQEVVPVFHKITEDMDDERNYKKNSGEQSKGTNSRNLSTTKSNNSLRNSKSNFYNKSDEINFLQQSLRQLKQVLDFKESLVSNQKNDDSDFIQAENLDITTLDERQTGTKARCSIMTFGNEQNDIMIENDQQSPKSNTQPFQYSLNKRSKITDLNKQCKNFNMPVLIKSDSTSKQNQTSSKIIDFEEIQKLKILINQINSSSIIQEFKKNKVEQSRENQRDSLVELRRRNSRSDNQNSQLLSYISNDSGISDDDSSIPADSFLQKNIQNHHNIMPQTHQRSQSPFNKFKAKQNLQSNYHSISEKLSKDKVPSRHDMFYPQLIQTDYSKNFNSLASLESFQTNENLQNSIQVQNSNINKIHSPVSNRNKDKFTPIKKGMTPLQPISPNIIDQSSKVIKMQPVSELISPQKSENDNENERYAHQIKEVNFDDQKGDLTNILNEDNIVADYYFQSYSKDCFQFTHSVQTSEIPMTMVNHSKRASMDPILWMLMKSDSPIREQQTGRQNSNEDLETVNINAIDDTQKIQFKEEKSQCSGQKNRNKENVLNTSSSPIKQAPKSMLKNCQINSTSERRFYKNSNPSIQQNTNQPLDESLPSQKILEIQQEEKPHLRTLTEQELNDSSQATTIRKINLDQTSQSNTKIQSFVGEQTNPFCINQVSSYSATKRRVDSISSQCTLADQVKQSIIDFKLQLQNQQTQLIQQQFLSQDTFECLDQTDKPINNEKAPSVAQKWISQEEKERNLAAINQQIILRKEESKKNFNTTNNQIDENLLQLNVKMSQKLDQKAILPGEESICQIEASSICNSQQMSCMMSERIIQQQIVSIEQSAPKAQTQVQIKLKQIVNLKESPQKVTRVSEKMAVDRVIIESCVSDNTQSLQSTNKQKVGQEILKDLISVQQSQESQNLVEFPNLETPSPRILQSSQPTPHFTFDQLKQISDELANKIQSSRESLRSSNQVQVNTQEVSFYRHSFEKLDQINDSSTVKSSSNLENLMIEYMKDQSRNSQNSQSTRVQEKLNHNVQVSNQQKTHQSSQQTEQILTSASDLMEIPKEQELQYQMQPHPQFPQLKKSVYEYVEQNQFSHQYEIEQINLSIQDQVQNNDNQLIIQLSPINTELQQTTQFPGLTNNTIQEEPSIEESESKQNIVIGDTFIHLQNGEQSSKISLANIVMQDSEIFSMNHDYLTSSQKDLFSGKSLKPQPISSDYSSNYNSNRYKTPLRHFMNSNAKSVLSTNNKGGYHASSLLKNQTIENTDSEIQTQKSSGLISPRILSPSTEEKKTPNKKPFFISKTNTCHESGKRVSMSTKKSKDKVIQRGNESKVSNREDNEEKSLKKMKIDFFHDNHLSSCNIFYRFKVEKCDKIDKKRSCILQQSTQIESESNRSNSRQRAQYSSVLYQQKPQNITPQKQITHLQNKNASSNVFSPQKNSETPLKSRVIPTSNQSKLEKKNQLSVSRQQELEIKLREKEERIKDIVARRKQLEEQRNQLRQLKEQAVSSSAKKENNENPKANIKQGGIYLRTSSQDHSNLNTANQVNLSTAGSVVSSNNGQKYTPSKSKIVIKKQSIQGNESISNSKYFCLKQDLMRKSNNATLYQTIEATQTPNQQKRLLPQSSIVDQFDTVLAPQTERNYSIKDQTSPSISSLQPTQRQMDFFKRIEGDCTRRKLKHQSRLEQVSTSRKQQNL